LQHELAVPSLAQEEDMGRRLHLIPLLALGAALNGCRDAVPPLAPTISRPRFSQVSGPLEGKITFNSNRNGNVDVFVMNPDGSGVTQVTTNPLDELLPLFSPDGTQIVFGRCSGICDIVVINADGSGERTILNDGFPGAWSPDGNRIVLGRNDGLYVINADGSGLVRVLDPDFVTDWSPDGRQLMIVSRRDGDLELYPTNLDGSGVTQLTHNTCDDNAGTGWSPDGTRIAFNNNCDGDNEIFVMNADGSGVTQLTQNEFDDGGAVWSPDGTQLAFESSRAGDTQIFVMNADGSNVTQLTSGPPGVTNFAPHWIRQLALSNDAFADATVISTLPFSDRVNISAASMEGGEPASSCSGGSSSQRTVWYSFTPAVTAVVRASVNASFSTVVGVYTGGLGGLAEIICRSPFVVRDATFLAQAGTTYHIQVDGMFAQTGVLEVRLEVVPPPPNDLFGNATAIGALPFNDTVDLTAASTEGGEPSPSCAAPFGGVSSSAWYRFTPTVTGSISANAFSGGFSNAVAAYTGTSVTSLTEVACGVFSNRATFRAVANTTYFFQVGGLFGQRGPLEFRLEVTPLPVANFFFFPFDASVFDVVQFVDQSFDPGGVGFAPQAWTFGDGMTGSTGNPTHRYAADGDYTVQLTVTTLDGRTAVASQTARVRTHDVAITRFSVPQTARSGQTKRLEVSINSKRYAETVEVQLFRSVPGGFQQFGSLTQSVPMNPKNGTTDFAFSYTFTADDATIGKVTFRAVAVISGARDALSADNEAIGPPTRVSR
jgi:PKD repeat protein